MRATGSDEAAHTGSSVVRDLAVLWAVSVCLRDALTRSAFPSATLLVLLQPLWLLRIVYTKSDWVQDLLIVLVFDYRSRGSGIFPERFTAWLHATQAEHAAIYLVLVLAAAFSGLIVLRGDDLVAEKGAHGVEEHFLPPLLIPSRTSHTRLFPKKHSFSYSYFYVGIPVGWKSCAGSALSADVQLLPRDDRRFGWFNVDAADHLDRGYGHLGLEGKLCRYLQSEGVSDDRWFFAYLVTAPRFLNYSFNPVSFWYLYDADAKLVMMVLEVNNTFDERRMYLLKADDQAARPESSLPNVDEKIDAAQAPPLPKNVVKFTNSWKKDFHVSPFNSRNGSYSLVANDPLSGVASKGCMIDNTITLRSSKEHGKLVARVFSEGKAKDPTMLSSLQLAQILLAWFWVGFATFPRILFEAWRLYFKRQLNVWFRPEVAPSSLGRSHTFTEQILADYFRAYLESLAKQCSTPLQVTYSPPGGMGEKTVFTSSAIADNGKQTSELTLRVLSPAFYGRFIHYSHTAEAFNREGFCADERNKTVMVTPADLLDLLPLVVRDPKTAQTFSKLNALDRMRWSVLRRLRHPPAASAYESTTTIVPTDIRSFPYSALDVFVQQQCKDVGNYRRAVIKSFLASRFTLGFTGVVDIADLLFRALLFAAAMNTTQWSRSGGDLDMGAVAGGLFIANMPHLWNLAK